MKYIITILILFVTLDCFSQSTQTFFKDSFAIFPQTRPITRLHVQGNAFITDSLRLTGLPIGSGSDSILSITTSGVVRKIVNGGGGTNTDNWDSVLIRQGSNPLINDYNIHGGIHNLVIDSLHSFVATVQDTTASQIQTGIVVNTVESQIFAANGSTNAASAGFATDDSLTLEAYTPTVISVGVIKPDYFKFTKYINGSGIPLKTTIIYEHPDTLLTTPEFMYVSDNDTIKKYPFSGGGGSSLFPTSGTGTATGTVTGELAANELKVTNSGNIFLDINTASGSENSVLQSSNGIGSGTFGLFTNVGNYQFGMAISDGANTVVLAGDAPSNTITLTSATLNINNAYTIPTTDGTSGQVLTTNGSGVASWQPSGGGTGLTRQIHTSGATVTVTGGNYILTIDPASTLAAVAVTLPASPNDLETVEIDFGGTLTSGTIVTALSILPNSGQTIIDNTPPTSATADNTIEYRFRSSINTWYRFKP